MSTQLRARIGSCFKSRSWSQPCILSSKVMANRCEGRPGNWRWGENASLTQLTERSHELFSRIEARAAGDDSDIDYSDIPRLTAEQLAQMVRLRGPRRKQAVSVRLDPEVLAWLRSKGEGHLTRINDILTNLMEAEQKSRRSAS